MHQHDHKRSFLRILEGDGKSKKPVGAGFLVTPTHVMTCAHVVADALGIGRNTFEKPTDMVMVDFPLLERQPGVKARVIEWFPLKKKTVTGDLEDIAVLEVLLDPSLPEKITPVPVVLLEFYSSDRSVRMCGFPYGADEGKYANGTLQGPTGEGWIEIQHDLSGGMVQEGFSGTAVWDKKENAVSGMIVAAKSHSGEKTAYMIPMESLRRAFPQLDGHSRPPNPYKGLEVFHEKDAPFFFGRETVTGDLSEIVREQPFVAVIGASGSGKSSLILAGLIPKLKASGKWLVMDFRPKDAPFYNLSLALISLLYNDKLEQLEKAKELTEKFKGGKIGINDMIEMIAREHPGRRYLLFADQFEELFTANPDKSVQQRFMDMLLEPLTVSSQPFTFLFTMRADFVSQAVGYGPFAHALDRYKPKILSSMNEEELTAVIEKPAEKLGVKLEPGLTQRILQDLGNEPGNLPLLEFALTQLWEMQRFRTMTHTAYKTGGGVKQALARHADRVFEGFSIDERRRIRQTFIQLVRPGEGTEDTRQVAFRGQFDEKKWNFIKRIADERLVVTGRSEESGRETVEVVHEALIKNWKPLREWIDEDRSFRIWQNNLRQAIADWEHAEKDDGVLFRGVRLTDAEEKLDQRESELGKDEIAFIQASLALREKETAAKKRIRIIGFAALMALLVILGAWVQRENNQARTLAEKLIEARHNLGYMFYERANLALKENKFNTARLYSLHALANFDPGRNGPGKAAGSIISNPGYPILFSSPDASHHNSEVTSVCFSPDGKTLASGSWDKTIRLWDMETGKEKAVLAGHKGWVGSVSFSPDGKTLASGSHDNSIRLWDVETGKEKVMLTGQKSTIYGVSFSPDSKTLALGAGDKTIRLCDVETGKEKAVLTGHTERVLSVSFSPDGKTLASGAYDHTIRLWDVETGKEKAVLTGHEEEVLSVSFSPDSKTLASASNTMTIRLWDVERGKEKAKLTGHTSFVRSVNFSPDSKTLASGALDKTIRLWDVETGKEKAVLTGHTSSILSVNFSPDGKTLASGATGNTIRLWDMETGKEKAVLTGHQERVTNVSLSPDGGILASGARDQTIRLWDVETGKEKAVLTGHTGWIEFVSFSPDGKTLASGAHDPSIRLWDVETGKEKANIRASKKEVELIRFSPDSKTLALGVYYGTIELWDVETGKEKAGIERLGTEVKNVRYSPDGGTLALGLNDKTIRLWDVETGKEKAVLTGHTESITCMNFSPDSKTLASGAFDVTIRLWDVESGKEKAVLTGYKDWVSSVNFSPDSKTLASRSEDRAIRLWNVETGKEKAVLTGHKDWVSNVSFSPDSKTLASGSGDKTIRLWDVETGKEMAVLTGNEYPVGDVVFLPDSKTLASGSHDSIRLWDVEPGNEKTKLVKHTDRVNAVSFSPDGKTLASGANDTTICLWDMETGKEKAVLTGNKHWVLSVSFSPDGKTLASGAWDKTIRLWDAETGKEKAILTGHTREVNSVSFSPDGKTLASGANDDTVRLWDVETGKEKAVLTGHTFYSVNSVRFSPDGRLLASGSSDTTICLWDVETGKEKAVLNRHAASVSSVCFSPDSKTLASGANDDTVRLWDVETGKEKAVLTGHTNSIFSVSFSPDAKTLASGSPDTTIRLWDVETGKEKAVLTGHKDWVTSVSFSPDSKTLASGSIDHTIRLWDISFLHDLRSIEEKIKDAEHAYNLELVNLNLQPIPPKRNLYGVKPQPPKWSRTHPFHWLSKAESGDVEAMVQLGIIYDRDNELEKAYRWYAKAIEAGSEHGKERMKIFRQWLKLHKDEYPGAYEKYRSYSNY